jgi:hypothetical protein
MTIIDKACYERGCACYDDRVDKDGVAVVAQRAVEAEREACAQLLDEMAARDKLSNYYAVAARAIRARGQDPMPLFDDWGKDWK